MTLISGNSNVKIEAENEDVIDAELLNAIGRLKLGLDQIDASILTASKLSIYTTAPENFSPLPNSIRFDGLKDFFPTCLADIFIGLCHAPKPSNDVLFLNSSAAMVPMALESRAGCGLTANFTDLDNATDLMENLNGYFHNHRDLVRVGIENITLEVSFWSQFTAILS